MLEIRPLVLPLRRLVARHVDVVLAAALAVAGVVELAQHGLALTPLAAGMVATSTVAVRGRIPRTACVIALVAGLLYSNSGGAPQSSIGPIVLVLDFYSLGSRAAAGGRGGIADLLVLLAAVPMVGSSPGDHLIDLVSVWLFFFLVPYAGGRVVGARRSLTRELRANAERLENQQRDRVRQASAEERTRIARELHDVVAHNVSVMVIQTVAARRVLAHDPEAARCALVAVEQCGREALGEMRRMVGVVRRGDLGSASVQPGLAQLPSLVERARAAGLEVGLKVDGAATVLPAPLDLVAFRVVQEALTNVIKHAGRAHVAIRVRQTPGSLEIAVSDDGGGNASQPERIGSGLLGMNERLAMYGGTLEAGRTRRGGFRVHAWLPLVPEVA